MFPCLTGKLQAEALEFKGLKVTPQTLCSFRIIPDIVFILWHPHFASSLIINVKTLICTLPLSSFFKAEDFFLLPTQWHFLVIGTSLDEG